MNKMFCMIASMALALGLGACSGGNSQCGKAAEAPEFVELGSFAPDSAYAYVEKQVSFGPRIPGTDAHKQCRQWLADKLSQFGADTVKIMGEPFTAWDGKELQVYNIFAQYKPEAQKRILLLAHYDTRPWADHDNNSDFHDKPFDGANDGASGVAVLLEIARNLQMKAPEVGVDILLTDVEDYGVRSGVELPDADDSWCIGSQQFASNMPYTAVNRPIMGILLDMVGGQGARFHKEYFSNRYASEATAKVWSMASRLGLTDRFINTEGGAITDDHIPLIRAGIPTVDIIENINYQTNGFNPTWHTHADNLQNIDRAPMNDVGRVVLNVIYNTKP